MRGLRVLDLFSGIGGFSLGLERTGDFETDAHTNPSSPHCGKGVAAGPAVSEGDRGHGAPVTSGAEVARAGVIDECLAAIDALKDFVPANPQGRVRFSIYDLTRAFRAGISMAREDIAALVSGSREDGPMRREADFPGEPTTIGELMRTPQTTPTRDEAVLRYYADTFCELGAHHECCGKLNKDECSGCLARSVLASAPAPASGGVDAVREDCGRA